MIRLEPGTVAAIVLDRPNQRNALTPAMLRAIPELADEAVAQGARAIVLRGEGRIFCAGFDLKGCVEDPRMMRDLLLALAEAIRALRQCPVPSVVACHGAAIAGGCALLGGADVVVANADAKLGYPVVRLGVSPAVSGPYLRQSIGDGPARARMLDTEIITGRRANELGLVHEVVGNVEEVGMRAMQIAQELADKPQSALAATRGWLTEIAGPGKPESERALAVSLELVGSSEERERLEAIWGASDG